jgi:hypothetical protein
VVTVRVKANQCKRPTGIAIRTGKFTPLGLGPPMHATPRFMDHVEFKRGGADIHMRKFHKDRYSPAPCGTEKP